jgi:hypothetical protein
MALGMSPGQAQAMGGGYQGGDTVGDPGGFAESLGEAPENGGGFFSKIGNVVKSLVSGTNQNTQKTQRTIPPSQNFLQKNANIQALLDKDYTISKSGNTLYAPYNENLISARDLAENQFSGIPNEIAFRSTAASINPETGMMFSGGVKGGALDRLTSSMMTPQRFQQNQDRTDKYAAQSRNALRSQKGKVGLTAEQREINRQESLFNLDLDGDGNIFTSTDDDGVVYGMSNKAIYDPSLPEAYRGIPSRYATGLPTTNAATGALGNVYGGQKTSDDRMLANEIMSYVMPGAGIVRGVNYLKDRFGSKAEPETIDSSGAFSSIVPSGSDFLSLPESEKNKFMSGTNPYAEKVKAIPMGEYNPLVGYRPDGSPVYAQDPDATQYQGVGMQ